MKRPRTTAARGAAPASWGALGAARGSLSAHTITLDPPGTEDHQKTALGSVTSR